MNSGWQIKRLDELYEIARGGSPRPIKNYMTTEPNGINWIKISDATASTKYIYETKEKIKPEGIKMSRLVHEGDFILSNSMSFGRPYIMKTTGCIHDGWLVFHAKTNQIDNDYMYYLLGSDVVYQQFDRLAAGSTVRNLNSDLVRGVTIPVPPLAEQQRIVAVLDEAFAGIATATENANKNLQNARELFESHLQSIFTNKGDGWVEKTLGDVCTFENGDRGTNYPSKSARTTTGIPFINAGHLTDDGIDMDEMDYISRERFNLLGNGKIRPNDILFCLRGSLGKVASVGSLVEGAIASSLVIIRPKDSVSGAFLLSYLKSHLCADMIAEFRNGAAQPNLSAGSLKKFSIPVPPISEQQSIVAQLDSLAIETKHLEAIYQKKLDNLAALKQSILQKAFAGELALNRFAA